MYSILCLQIPRIIHVMAGGRNSTITMFILLGFSEFPKLTVVLFSVFLGIYLMTVSWNVGLPHQDGLPSAHTYVLLPQ